MRYANTRAAQDHYDDLAEPDSRGEIRAAPTDDSLVHALLRPPQDVRFSRVVQWSTPPGKHSVFLDSWCVELAACGRRVKVILPMEFNDSDPGACVHCVKHVAAWKADGRAWWHQQQQRELERWQREDERHDAAAWLEEERRRRQVHVNRGPHGLLRNCNDQAAPPAG